MGKSKYSKAGRPMVELTDEQKKFILENHEKMRHQQIADQLGLGSRTPIQRILRNMRKGAFVDMEPQPPEPMFDWRQFHNDIFFGNATTYQRR
jgi:hypothetical protein